MKQIEKTPRRPGAIGWLGLVLIFVFLVSACRPAPAPPEPPAPPTEPPAPTAPAPVAEEPTEEAEPTPEPTVDLAPELVDKLWLLVAFGDAANPAVVEEGTVVTALFSADGNLSGTGGCNNYSTSYELSGDQLTVGSPIASTMMACEKGMNQETAVLAALEGAQRIAFSPEGRLEIFYDAGGSGERKMVFAPGETPLVDTVWVLESMGAPDNPTLVQSGMIITAIFASEGTLSGSAGCNNYSAGYTVEDGQIEIQQPISTLRACTQGMEQEAAYLEALTSQLWAYRHAAFPEPDDRFDTDLGQPPNPPVVTKHHAAENVIVPDDSELAAATASTASSTSSPGSTSLSSGSCPIPDTSRAHPDVRTSLTYFTSMLYVAERRARSLLDVASEASAWIARSTPERGIGRC